MANEKMKTGRGVEPVVEHPKLPRMTDKPPRPKKIEGKILLMAEKPRADTGKTKRMPPVAKTGRGPVPSERGDQEAPRAARPTAKEPEGYVRLRLRVHNGEMSVVGAKAVEGPLVESKLQGAMAYEVTLGPRRVAAGGVPDAGERRSFPDPKATTAEQQGHYVTELPSYEVNVRVPKEQVSLAALPRLEIALYRIKEELPEEAPALAAETRLGVAFERELREVGRLKGIKPDTLDEPVADEVKKAFE